MRIAVRRNRWIITLHDLRNSVVLSFEDFGALAAHLESVASNRALIAPEGVATQATPGCPHGQLPNEAGET